MDPEGLENAGDDESAQVCAQCGATAVSSAERSFAFGVGTLLCWSCAIERGGRYDAEREVWTTSPDVSDLPDEAYGAAPRDA